VVLKSPLGNISAALVASASNTDVATVELQSEALLGIAPIVAESFTTWPSMTNHQLCKPKKYITEKRLEWKKQYDNPLAKLVAILWL